ITNGGSPPSQTSMPSTRDLPRRSSPKREHPAANAAGGIKTGVLPGSGGLENARGDEALLGLVPTVRRMRGGERGQRGPQLRAVARRGKDPNLLHERVGVGAQVRGLAVGQVPHVRVLAAVEGDEVLELAEHAERAPGRLASAD